MRRNTLRAVAALAAALACTPALAKKAAKKAAAKTPALAMPDVKQWQLPNGLKVVFLADHKAPVVTVQVFYHVGSKDEPEGRHGMAHMFEHMMFKGSTHVRPEQHARFVDALGGNENAFTQDDLTGYFDTVPPAALDFTVKLEAERMRNLKLTQKTIDSEREVVKEELRVNFENNPIQKALMDELKLAYKVHPYQHLAIGTKEELDKVTVEDCKKFYDEYYQPNNATFIVVGDTDEKTVRDLADKYFGVYPKGPEIVRNIPVEPPQTEERAETVKDKVQLPVIIGAYHIPAGSSDDRYALEVLQQILSAGESSRMHERLVRKDHSAVAAGGFVFAHEDPGLFLTFAAYLPGTDVALVKKGLHDEIARVAAEKVTPHELEKARNQLATEAVFGRERVSAMATRIGDDGIVAHDPLRQFSAPAKYDAVTADDVMRVAKQYLQDSNYTETTLVPEGAEAAK